MSYKEASGLLPFLGRPWKLRWFVGFHVNLQESARNLTAVPYCVLNIGSSPTGFHIDSFQISHGCERPSMLEHPQKASLNRLYWALLGPKRYFPLEIRNGMGAPLPCPMSLYPDLSRAPGVDESQAFPRAFFVLPLSLHLVQTAPETNSRERRRLASLGLGPM